MKTQPTIALVTAFVLAAPIAFAGGSKEPKAAKTGQTPGKEKFNHEGHKGTQR